MALARTLSHRVLLTSEPSSRLMARSCFSTLLRSWTGHETHTRAQQAAVSNREWQRMQSEASTGKAEKGLDVLATLQPETCQQPGTLATNNTIMASRPTGGTTSTDSHSQANVEWMMPPQATGDSPLMLPAPQHTHQRPQNSNAIAADSCPHTCRMLFLLRCLRSARKSSNVP